MIQSRLSVIALLVAGALSLACSRQAEGERCSVLNGNQDCEGSLVCTAANRLRNNDASSEVSRCCPEDGGSSGSQCALKTGGDASDNDSTTSGAAGGGGGGATSTTESTSGIGDACQWNSECPDELVCGPTGVCQAECKEDRDCTAGFICDSSGSCVAE